MPLLTDVPPSIGDIVNNNPPSPLEIKETITKLIKDFNIKYDAINFILAGYYVKTSKIVINNKEGVKSYPSMLIAYNNAFKEAWNIEDDTDIHYVQYEVQSVTNIPLTRNHFVAIIPKYSVEVLYNRAFVEQVKTFIKK